MSLSLVIDMNLSPEWAEVLRAHGHDALHWMDFGDPRAADVAIMAWARANGRVVFTHDLDFGTLLALTHADGPSVVQVRAADVLPERLGGVVAAALAQYEGELRAGALVVVEVTKSRVRVLPL